MASRALSDLRMPCYTRAEAMMVALEGARIPSIITCTYRSPAEQDALFMQGRNPLDTVNARRQGLGLLEISAAENKLVVTNARAGESAHNYGLAFDIVPLDSGKPIWDSKSAIWLKIGNIGQACGLEWAGTWKIFKEFPHFQYLGGLTIADLKAGKIPG